MSAHWVWRSIELWTHVQGYSPSICFDDDFDALWFVERVLAIPLLYTRPPPWRCGDTGMISCDSQRSSSQYLVFSFICSSHKVQVSVMETLSYWLAMMTASAGAECASLVIHIDLWSILGSSPRLTWCSADIFLALLRWCFLYGLLVY